MPWVVPVPCEAPRASVAVLEMVPAVELVPNMNDGREKESRGQFDVRVHGTRAKRADEPSLFPMGNFEPIVGLPARPVGWSLVCVPVGG